MRDRDLLYSAKTVNVSFSIEPVYNMMTMMEDLACYQDLEGMGDWVYQTARSLPPDLMHQHRLFFDALHHMYADVIEMENCGNFPAFIETFSTVDPYVLRDSMIETLRQIPEKWFEPGEVVEPVPTAEQLLNDCETYRRWHKIVHYLHSCDDADLIAEAHMLLNDPVQLHKRATQHLRLIWRDVMAPEWERVLATFQASVSAFKKLDYSQLTLFEAIRAVTGRDMRSHWERAFNHVDSVIFIPTAHSGPYVTKYLSGKTLRLTFTARLPKGIQTGSATLTRAQLLIWLNALSDDSRLRILELLTHEDQLRAQDIIEQIGLSQSVISRHLSQLSATGYLNESREDGIKYYSLNLERVEETTNALLHFLRKK